MQTATHNTSNKRLPHFIDRTVKNNNALSNLRGKLAIIPTKSKAVNINMYKAREEKVRALLRKAVDIEHDSVDILGFGHYRPDEDEMIAKFEDLRKERLARLKEYCKLSEEQAAELAFRMYKKRTHGPQARNIGTGTSMVQTSTEDNPADHDLPGQVSPGEVSPGTPGGCSPN